MVLSIRLRKMVLTLRSVAEALVCAHSDESNTFMWYCLLSVLSMGLTLRSVDETLVCDHSRKASSTGSTYVMWYIPVTLLFKITSYKRKLWFELSLTY